MDRVRDEMISIIHHDIVDVFLLKENKFVVFKNAGEP